MQIVTIPQDTMIRLIHLLGVKYFILPRQIDSGCRFVDEEGRGLTRYSKGTRRERKG